MLTRTVYRQGREMQCRKATLSGIMMNTSETLDSIYKLMLKRFGPQLWWPAETPYEVMVGAILTQNTNWTNVDKALGNLKAQGMLNPVSIARLDVDKLAELIRPAGYYNVKAKRLKNFNEWLLSRCDGKLKELARIDTGVLREELLTVSGVGRETADSILLYALDRTTFVVDTYTARIFFRHFVIDADADYELIKEICEQNLPADRQVFNEYHALLVRTGKDFCRPKAQCASCPLNGLPHDAAREAF
jgi:endonuclease III related protein